MYSSPTKAQKFLTFSVRISIALSLEGHRLDVALALVEFHYLRVYDVDVFRCVSGGADYRRGLLTHPMMLDSGTHSDV